MSKIVCYIGSLFVLILTPITFLIVVMPFGLVSAPFPLALRLGINGRAWKAFSVFLLKYAFFTNIETDDRRDSEFQKSNTPPGLYIANHQSFLDIPVLITRFQIPPIMKKEILYIPIFGIIGYASGSLVVDRKSHKSRKKVMLQSIQRLKHKTVGLQYYPEGTRSLDGRPKSFENIKTKLMEHAFDNNITVNACSIYGTNGIVGKNGVLSEDRRIGLILHRALKPGDYDSRDEFMRACWQLVIEGYNELDQKINKYPATSQKNSQPA